MCLFVNLPVFVDWDKIAPRLLPILAERKELRLNPPPPPPRPLNRRERRLARSIQRDGGASLFWAGYNSVGGIAATGISSNVADGQGQASGSGSSSNSGISGGVALGIADNNVTTKMTDYFDFDMGAAEDGVVDEATKDEQTNVDASPGTTVDGTVPLDTPALVVIQPSPDNVAVEVTGNTLRSGSTNLL